MIIPHIKKITGIAVISLILTAFLVAFADFVPPLEFLNRKIYDTFVKIELRLASPPAAINDILLVTIDNQTLRTIGERWPYPRAFFAKVIENLKQAGAKLIAFDFVFLGKSNPEDDALLKKSLESGGKSVLATAINEEGSIEFSTNSALSNGAPSGIITKFQDPDGVTRKNLTYLVSNKELTRGFLSWEMRILKEAKEIDLSSFETKDSIISFKARDGEKWIVPVSKSTKSFLIHFRARTMDFRRLSFSKVLEGNFDPALVKDKIVLVGFSSSVFGDLHNTPIGWLPGLTLNANAFLTLYAHDFLRNLPKYFYRIALVLGIILSSIFVTIMRPKTAVLIILVEIVAFFAISYVFLAIGYVYNYSIFPIAISLCPFLSKKIYLLFLSKETIYY